MSLFWNVRVDRYQRCDEQIVLTITKKFSLGYELKVCLEFYEDFSDGNGSVLCSQILENSRIFATLSSLEMFVSRLKKQFCLSVDGLLERTYFFGSQFCEKE